MGICLQSPLKERERERERKRALDVLINRDNIDFVTPDFVRYRSLDMESMQVCEVDYYSNIATTLKYVQLTCRELKIPSLHHFPSLS